jgi:hypothetical protein
MEDIHIDFDILKQKKNLPDHLNSIPPNMGITTSYILKYLLGCEVSNWWYKPYDYIHYAIEWNEEKKNKQIRPTALKDVMLSDSICKQEVIRSN